MKILFLTQILPYPLDAGPKVRAYYVLRYLLQHHDVTLLSFVRAGDPLHALDHLRSLCSGCHFVEMKRSRARDARFLAQSLLSSTPFLIGRDRRDEMLRKVKEVVVQAAANGTPFDAVHADQSWMANYALHAAASAPAAHRPMTVLDQHNAVYLITQRLGEQERNPIKRAALMLEAYKMARWEVQTCLKFDRLAWVTAQDLAAVTAKAADLHAGASIRNDGIIPICGDPEATPPLEISPTARRVTFLGGLHYPPNAQGIIWYARHAFPQVLAACPDAVLTVIGKQPPGELHELGIPPANLDVTGYVEDPLPYLRETAAFVVPLLAGGGMRVKIVDGWVWGLPIVSTAVGAEGIALDEGTNIWLAETPADLAHATIALLQDGERRLRLARAGRAWVLERYNWRTTYRAWDSIYPSEAAPAESKGKGEQS